MDSIHAVLRKLIPDDALCLIGLTMANLYEDDSDLFVAGLAAGNQRVAVGIRGWVNRGMQNCRSVMIY